jgi:hypothetical protein
MHSALPVPAARCRSHFLRGPYAGQIFNSANDATKYSFGNFGLKPQRADVQQKQDLRIRISASPNEQVSHVKNFRGGKRLLINPSQISR